MKEHLMKRPIELFRNLVYRTSGPPETIQSAVKELLPWSHELEAIHIYVDFLNPLYWRNQKYVRVLRHEIASRLDEWIYEHLVDQGQYASYLDRYRSLLISGKIADIDRLILDKHYRRRAVNILSKKKSFDLKRWTKTRTHTEYHRKYNVFWKDGPEIELDSRNLLTSLFIRKQSGERVVLGIGGGGSSGQRETGTFYTAVFYLIGRKKRIPHYLVRYNSMNEYEYADMTHKTVWTADLGSNFSLDKELLNEIKSKGIYWQKIFRKRDNQKPLSHWYEKHCCPRNH